MLTVSKWNSAKRAIFVAICVLLAPLPRVNAATAALDFENLPAGTTITTQYTSRGVRFAGAFLATHEAASSGTRVLRSLSPAVEIFTARPFRMDFLNPQRHVQFFAMSPATARIGTLRVFSSGNTMIAQDGPKLVNADKFTTLFQVSLPAARIRRAELRLEGAAHFAIDDLSFGTTPATGPPVRVIDLNQPAARENASIHGRFSPEFHIGVPPPSAASGTPPAGDGDEPEMGLEGAPVIEKDLNPGTSTEIVTQLSGRHGVAGSVRWSGTSAPLQVRLSANGTVLANGKTYALGETRGGADVLAVANNGGAVKLSVTNISGVRVKVRLILNFIRGEAQ
jgi:hypothetical protein